MVETRIIQNPSWVADEEGWAIYGKYDCSTTNDIRLWPGSSAKQCILFETPILNGIFIWATNTSGSVGKCEVYFGGVLICTLTRGAKFRIYPEQAPHNIPYGNHLLEFRVPSDNPGYFQIDTCVIDIGAIASAMGYAKQATRVGPGVVDFFCITSSATYLWDFGDGATSTEQNPSHEYVELGEYIASVTTTAGTKHILVSVQSPLPLTLQANHSPEVAPPNTSIQFSEVTHRATSWLWDFGDGATSTEQNPTHSYATKGTYTVTLTAINEYGQSSINKSVTIKPYPIPNFSASPVQGLTVQFSDLSLEDPTSWSWDFGENEKTLQNPVHSYQQPGTYNVTLTATNAMGSQPITKSIPVTVSDPVRPDANFSYQPTESNKTQIEFTDLSSNAPSSWLWSFGDGTTSTEQNPVHQYTTGGVYSVRLTVTNANGDASVSKPVSVITPGTTPPTSGTVTPGTAQAGRMVSVVVTGTRFKPNARIRVTHGGFRGTVSKVKSFTSTRIEFSFCFESWFIGSCGVMISNTDGSTIVIPDCITVTE